MKLPRAMISFSVVLLFVATLALPRHVNAALTVLDATTDAFPPNPCLPNTAQRAIFDGVMCDAGACPPGTLVPTDDPCIQFYQTGLPGVLGGHRGGFIDDWDDIGDSTVARLALGQIGVSISMSAGIPSSFEMNYDAGRGNVGLWNWNLDLSGASAFFVTLDGDITPDHPVYVFVRLASLLVTDPFPFGGSQGKAVVTQPGTVALPLSLFTQMPFRDHPADLRSVDGITIVVSNCDEAPCAEQPARHFTVGPISFGDGPTASVRRSWGQVKTTYR